MKDHTCSSQINANGKIVRRRHLAQRTRVIPRTTGGWLGIVAIGLALVADRAVAGPVFSITSSGREVAAFGTSICPGCGENGEDVIFSDGESIPTSSMGLFDEHANSVGSTAYQSSVVSSQELSGTGTIDLGATGDNNALSSLLVEFTVLQTDSYRLTGDVTISPSEFETEASVTLSSAGGDLFSAIQSFGGSTGFDESILLEAGVSYTLDASVAGTDFEGLGSSGGWSVTLIPEPASALLLVGLSLASAARRRFGKE